MKHNYMIRVWVGVFLLAFCFSSFSYANDYLDKINGPLVKITEKVMPSIVFLKVTRQSETKEIINQEKKPDLYDDFFLDPLKRPPKNTQMVGSGVIVSTEGYVITNNHVIAEASEIKVVLNNNDEYEGKVVGTDIHSDLAVIQFFAKKGSYKVANLGNSAKLRVGELVLALGSPFGLRKSVTQGIVSAKGRKNGFGVNFIQTDAAINPGNSGGALVNTKGEVIGINSLILTQSLGGQGGGFQGIGLAIPINLVKKVMKQIIANGRVIRGFLGIRPANADESMSMKLRIKKGVLINEVLAKSPAEKAGIKPWDLLIGVENKEIKDFDHLREIVTDTKVGSEITISLIRNDKTIKVKVKIGDLDLFGDKKIEKKIVTPIKPKIDMDDPSIGLELKSLSKDDLIILSKETQINVNYGLIVLKVKENSIGAKSEFDVGDIILEVEGEKVKNPAMFNLLIRKHKKNNFLRIRVIKKVRFVVMLAVTL
ncbi:MAG: trypsin-like peptidase domain-containing protein [Spirochaetota bacterium]|nr:trypsin-like peptidase domain-containing protein [Spirochaetota bacterium]